MRKKLKEKDELWGEFDLREAAEKVWDIVSMKIRYKLAENELWISHSYSKSEATWSSSEQLEWSRWAIEKQNKKIQFTPIFPDRPVVIKPENNMRLAYSGRTRIYVRVPLWIRIELINSSSINILELPTVVLSNTWFGTVTAGELCYWISTGARQQIAEDHSRPYLGICPIQLINKSNQDVIVEKLCLRVDGLSLFNHNGQIWSDETRVTYRGATDISEIEFSGKAPKEAKNATLISKPRKQAKKGIKAKFFS